MLNWSLNAKPYALSCYSIRYRGGKSVWQKSRTLDTIHFTITAKKQQKHLNTRFVEVLEISSSDSVYQNSKKVIVNGFQKLKANFLNTS